MNPEDIDPEDIRRMVAGWQAVNEREREERRKAGPDPAATVSGLPKSRREALAANIEQARQELARGEVQRGTVDELMAEIDE